MSGRVKLSLSDLSVVIEKQCLKPDVLFESRVYFLSMLMVSEHWTTGNF